RRSGKLAARGGGDVGLGGLTLPGRTGASATPPRISGGRTLQTSTYKIVPMRVIPAAKPSGPISISKDTHNECGLRTSSVAFGGVVQPLAHREVLSAEAGEPGLGKRPGGGGPVFPPEGQRRPRKRALRNAISDKQRRAANVARGQRRCRCTRIRCNPVPQDAD